MTKLTKKQISSALTKVEEFKKLLPEEMGIVLINEIRANGKVRGEAMTVWQGVNQEAHPGDPEQRMDIIVDILMDAKPERSLIPMLELGMLKYCLSECFPPRGTTGKRDLANIVGGFRLIDEDPVMRLTVLMFPFEPCRVKDLLTCANYDPETVEWIYDALNGIEKFMMIRDKVTLKGFINQMGWDRYYFFNDLMKNLFNVLPIPNQKKLAKESMVMEIRADHDPIFTEDLEVTKEDLIEAGIPEDKAEGILNDLTDFIHAYPDRNDRKRLLSKGKTFNKNKMARSFRKIRWVK